MSDPNGELQAILGFVAQDDAEFDIEEFIRLWPKSVAGQRLAQGMLSTRNGRELQRHHRSIRRLWLLAGVAFVLGASAFTLAAGLDVLGAGVAAILSGGLSVLARAVWS